MTVTVFNNIASNQPFSNIRLLIININVIKKFGGKYCPAKFGVLPEKVESLVLQRHADF